MTDKEIFSVLGLTDWQITLRADLGVPCKALSDSPIILVNYLWVSFCSSPFMHSKELP